jgi:hypothetical protein
MVKAVIIGVLLISIVVYFIGTIEPRYPPGILVPEDPDQGPVGASRSWPVGKYQITALADFRLRARVLHTEPYWLDHGADLSPVDLALGWGRMSDQSVVDELEFWQGQRWYRYWPRKSKFPIPPDEMVSHSANMHMIPANREVKDVLRSVGAGKLIQLSGYLVEARGPDGSTWRSSLSRTDTGAGACELVWVDKISAR